MLYSIVPVFDGDHSVLLECEACHVTPGSTSGVRLPLYRVEVIGGKILARKKGYCYNNELIHGSTKVVADKLKFKWVTFKEDTACFEANSDDEAMLKFELEDM